ncbi:MAG: hypothetical protein WCF90_06110 [Methanomicrobiales archaeon]
MIAIKTRTKGTLNPSRIFPRLGPTLFPTFVTLVLAAPDSTYTATLAIRTMINPLKNALRLKVFF